jgi:hypothetical protein
MYFNFYNIVSNTEHTEFKPLNYFLRGSLKG